jgi:hypothetical protein
VNAALMLTAHVPSRLQDHRRQSRGDQVSPDSLPTRGAHETRPQLLRPWGHYAGPRHSGGRSILNSVELRLAR